MQGRYNVLFLCTGRPLLSPRGGSCRRKAIHSAILSKAGDDGTRTRGFCRDSQAFGRN